MKYKQILEFCLLSCGSSDIPKKSSRENLFDIKIDVCYSL